MKQKLINAWIKIKQGTVKLEVWIKSTAVVAVAGGLNVIHEMYSQGITFAATHEHYVLLKAKFIAGAATGLVAYWLDGPFAKFRPKQ